MVTSALCWAVLALMASSASAYTVSLSCGRGQISWPPPAHVAGSASVLGDSVQLTLLRLCWPSNPHCPLPSPSGKQTLRSHLPQQWHFSGALVVTTAHTCPPLLCWSWQHLVNEIPRHSNGYSGRTSRLRLWEERLLVCQVYWCSAARAGRMLVGNGVGGLAFRETVVAEEPLLPHTLKPFARVCAHTKEKKTS